GGERDHRELGAWGGEADLLRDDRPGVERGDVRGVCLPGQPGRPDVVSEHEVVEDRRGPPRRAVVDRHRRPAEEQVVGQTVEGVLLRKRQDRVHPAPPVVPRVGPVVVLSSAVGVAAVRVVEGVERQTDLLEVVLAVGPCGGLADLLDGRKQEPDQDGNDRDHHQQLDQREGRSTDRTGAEHGPVSERGWDNPNRYEPTAHPGRGRITSSGAGPAHDPSDFPDFLFRMKLSLANSSSVTVVASPRMSATARLPFLPVCSWATIDHIPLTGPAPPRVGSAPHITTYGWPSFGETRMSSGFPRLARYFRMSSKDSGALPVCSNASRYAWAIEQRSCSAFGMGVTTGADGREHPDHPGRVATR